MTWAVGKGRRRGGAVRRRGGVGAMGIIALGLGVLLALFFAYPVLAMVWRALFAGGVFQWKPIYSTLSDPTLHSYLIDTAAFVGGGGFVALLIGAAFAWLNERTDASMGWVSRALPLVPLVLPPIALSVGWFFLAHPRAGILNLAIESVASKVGIHWWENGGPLNIATWQGLGFVYAIYLVPYAYTIIASAFQNADPSLDEASRVGGAGKLRTFWMVSLPSIRPAVAAAALTVCIAGLSQFSIPLVIGTAARKNILTVRIVSMMRSYPPRTEQAIVLGLIVVIVVAGFWLVERQIAKRSRYASVGGKHTTRARVQLGAWKYPARIIMIAYLAATSVLPLIALALTSLQRFWSPNLHWRQLSFGTFEDLFVSGSDTARALENSLGLAIVGATLGIVIAAVLMVYVHRSTGPFRGAIDGLTKAPGAVSHIVIGIALIVALGGSPFYLAGTTVFLLIAYIVVYMPQASLAVGAGVEQIGPELLEASAVTGASGGRTFLRVVVPLVRSSLAGGWALMFVVMIGDLTVSSLLASGSSPVVGFVLYDIWGNSNYSVLAAMATIVGLISFVVVAVVTAVGRSTATRQQTS